MKINSILNPFFNINAVKVNRRILRISASAAVVISIWPKVPDDSPLALRIGRIIPIDVVTMISAKYHLLFIFTINDNPLAAPYERIRVRKK